MAPRVYGSVVVASMVLASAAFIGACGSDQPALTPTAATALQSQVADARAAVAAGQYARARALLDAIDARVAQLGAQGDVSDGRSTQLHHAVAEVRAALTAYVATTSTTTTTTRPTPTTKAKAPPPSAKDNRPGRSNNGKPGEGGKGD